MTFPAPLAPRRASFAAPACLRLALPMLFTLACSTAGSAPNQAAITLQSLAATCANCHGTQGKAIDKSEVPGLASLPAPYLAEQMNAFKSGARPATVMHQIAKGYSAAQIDALAQYFAAQPR